MSAFIDEHRDRFGVEPICRTLGVSASAYYQRATGERSARAVEDERLLGVIREMHARNYYAYGSRRMWKALRGPASRSPRCRVERLMRAARDPGRQAAREAVADHEGRSERAARSPDLVKRDFTAARPERAVGRGFHVSALLGGRRVLRFVIDVYSRMIVGWQFAGHMRTDLVLDALRMALGLARARRRRRAGRTHRRRQSNTRRSTTPRSSTTTTCSPRSGSVGDAYDNALAESFVDTFKTELIADRVWRTRSQLELAIVEYVAWFNNDRLHASLGDIPPVEFEQHHAVQLALPSPLPGNRSVIAILPRAADRLTTRRLAAGGVDLGLERSTPAENGPVVQTLVAQAAPQAGEG